MTTKEVALSALSISAFALIGYGKFKLATSRSLWWVIILGALIFVASTPAQAE